jgi:hypothetical protein
MRNHIMSLYSNKDTIGLGTVFARFDNPEYAARTVDWNRYSGKWSWTVETAIYDLVGRLRVVMG